MVLGVSALRLDPPSGPPSAGAGSGCRSGGTVLAAGPFVEASGNPLRIKIYYILCSSAESTPIIVARANRRKRFLTPRGRPLKGPKNQGLSSEFCFPLSKHPPSIHRFVHRCGGQLISASGPRQVSLCRGFGRACGASDCRTWAYIGIGSIPIVPISQTPQPRYDRSEPRVLFGGLMRLPVRLPGSAPDQKKIERSRIYG
jgi:hypothetical protein